MTALGAFAKHLNELIESGQTSPTRIHEGTGISRSSINEYLKEERAPTLDQAQRIAEFLGFSLKAMLSEETLPKRVPAPETPENALLREGMGLLLALHGDELTLALQRLRTLSRPIGNVGVSSKKTKPSAG